MGDKNLLKILAILVAVLIVASCIAPCIAVVKSANTASNRSEEFTATMTMTPSPSPFYAKQFPAGNTTMHVHPQKLFRHEIYMPDEASAYFGVHYSAYARSNNDTITSGLHLVQYHYGLSINNFNDTSDAVLGNIKYTLQADNIVYVRDEDYAEWNESYVKWVFPSDFVLAEGDVLYVSAYTSLFETKYVPMSIGRNVNKSIFDAAGYQLAEFNVMFEDMNFNYYEGMVKAVHKAQGDSLVNASFLPDTFTTDAPLNPSVPFAIKTEHEIGFLLDKSRLQANETYNFSVIVRVDLKGDNPSPIRYKPYYSIYLGFNTSSGWGPTGKNVTIPSEMLPEHIHFASASTNVSNKWLLGRANQLGVRLEKVSEPIGPKSEIHVHKNEYLSTYDTHIDHNKIYNFTTGWDANVWEVENLDNVTYTITTSKNFTYIDNWELYQNGTENTFLLPPTVEGQNYTWFLPLEDRIGSNINFVLDSPQPVQDNTWADMDVSTTDENSYTRVNVTFTPVVPLDWINFRVRGDQVIDISAYPSEFEIEMLTSSYVMFDSGDINQDQVYNFSVLVDNHYEVELELYASVGWQVEPPSNIITLPVAELGGVTVKADVPVIWEHRPTLPQNVQSIAIEFEKIKGFDTGSPENPYPSIFGTHKGTITPNQAITVTELYTYPCTGTGGHTEYAAFYYPNGTLIAEANWTGYSGDWHNILFLTSFSLEAGKAYDYTIRTGSYPQIIHNQTLTNAYGTINCTKFVDANGKEYKDLIPAIRLE